MIPDGEAHVWRAEGGHGRLRQVRRSGSGRHRPQPEAHQRRGAAAALGPCLRDLGRRPQVVQNPSNDGGVVERRDAPLLPTHRNGRGHPNQTATHQVRPKAVRPGGTVGRTGLLIGDILPRGRRADDVGELGHERPSRSLRGGPLGAAAPWPRGAVRAPRESRAGERAVSATQDPHRSRPCPDRRPACIDVYDSTDRLACHPAGFDWVFCCGFGTWGWRVVPCVPVP